MLLELAMDNNIPLGEIKTFFKRFITNEHNFFEVIDNLKHKLDMNNMNDILVLLRPFVLQYKPTTEKLLSTLHHLSCTKCNFQIQPTTLYNWIKNNKEVFDTELYFFHLFFSQFNPVDNIGFIDLSYVTDGTAREEYRLVNTLIVQYLTFI